MKFSLFTHVERITDGQTHAELYDDFIARCMIADEGAFYQCGDAGVFFCNGRRINVCSQK